MDALAAVAGVLYTVWSIIPTWAWTIFGVIFIGVYFFSSFRRGFERYVEHLVDRRLDQRRDRD